MHVHLPKAFHGWREFAKEVGIIVLGVLIALGFEQLVQMWHWREEAQQTRESLRHEIAQNVLFAIERVAIEPCLTDRINHLAVKLNEEGTHWNADPMVLSKARSQLLPLSTPESNLPRSFVAPTRPWLADEWDTAKSTGIINHFGHQETSRLEFFFSNVNRIRALQSEEQNLAGQLTYLSFGHDLQPQMRSQALATVGQLDSIEDQMRRLARQMVPGPMPMRNYTRTYAHAPISFAPARAEIVNVNRAIYGPCVRDSAAPVR